jgi:hypothetical protein
LPRLQKVTWFFLPHSSSSGQIPPWGLERAINIFEKRAGDLGMRNSIVVLLAAGALMVAGSVAMADSTTTTTTDTTTTPTSTTSTTTTTTTPGTTTAAVTDPGSTIVCRTTGPTIGSRLGSHRICKTQREWDEQQHQQEQMVTEKQQVFGNPGGH